MAAANTFVFNNFKYLVGVGGDPLTGAGGVGINLPVSTGTNRFYAMLIDNTSDLNTGANEDNLKDYTTRDSFGTLGGFTGTGYTQTDRFYVLNHSNDLTLVTNPVGAGDNYVRWDCADPIEFGATISAGNLIIGMLVCHYGVGAVGTDIPCIWFKFTEFSANGGSITVQWATGGIMQLT